MKSEIETLIALGRWLEPVQAAGTWDDLMKLHVAGNEFSDDPLIAEQLTQLVLRFEPANLNRNAERLIGKLKESRAFDDLLIASHLD